jgi:hypothetical protein
VGTSSPPKYQRCPVGGSGYSRRIICRRIEARGTTRQVHVVRLGVELGQFRLEVGAHLPRDLFEAFELLPGEKWGAGTS